MLLFQPAVEKSSWLIELTEGADLKALLETVAWSWPILPALLEAPLLEAPLLEEPCPDICQFITVIGTT